MIEQYTGAIVAFGKNNGKQTEQRKLNGARNSPTPASVCPHSSRSSVASVLRVPSYASSYEAGFA
jgi:hypothetical protein